MADVSNAAIQAFQAGDYVAAEAAWRRAAKLEPNNPYVLSSLGTCVLIVAQESISLDKPLSADAEKRLEEALVFIDRALQGGLGNDPIVLNQRANVYNLWRRWPEAVDAYRVAVKVSPVNIASIPRQNLALALYEMGDVAGAEKEAAALLRRDPEFIDARALLAASRWSRGDEINAENCWAEICEGLRPPKPTNLLGQVVQDAGLSLGVSKYVARSVRDGEFCTVYNKMSAVRGRWPPRALAAYAKFLSRRDGGGGDDAAQR